MLEITNLRDGAVLDRNFGTETEDYLEIKVQGIADPQAEVKVNGERACRHDRNFCATVKLTEKINEITVVADSYFGKEALTITVAWDKKYYSIGHVFDAELYPERAKNSIQHLVDHKNKKIIKQ